MAEQGSPAEHQEEIDRRVRESHAASRQTYGSPRITADLIDDGYKIDWKTVATSIRQRGLEGVLSSIFTPVTIQGVPRYDMRDLVSWEWGQGALYVVWISGIVYLSVPGRGIVLVRDPRWSLALGDRLVDGFASGRNWVCLE